ncbi:MAG: LLM class flavin-dependent oxidoreductase, partial [Candidatus Ranarchaeia archaeon]
KILELAGEIADGVLINGTNPLQLRKALNSISKGEKKRIVKYPPKKVASILVSIASDETEAYDQARRLIVMIAAGAPSTLQKDLKLNSSVISQIQLDLQKGDILQAEQRVTANMIDAFCVAGCPEEALEKILRIKKLGLDEITVATPNGVNKIETIRVFKKHILQHLH